MKKVFDRRRLCTEADLFQTRKRIKLERQQLTLF